MRAILLVPLATLGLLGAVLTFDLRSASAHGDIPPPVPTGSRLVTAKQASFDPITMFVDAGQTIYFRKMSGHNFETLDGFVPEGQEKIYTDLGKDVELVFDVPGIIVYKCTPHWGAVMGGILVVGDPPNLKDLVEEYRDKAESNNENGVLSLLEILDEHIMDRELG